MAKRPGPLAAFAMLTVSNLLAAFIIAVAMLTELLALASLMFSGELENGLFFGTGLLLVGALIGGILQPLASSFKSLATGPRSSHLLVLAAMISSLMTVMAGYGFTEKLTTAVVMILLSSFIVGLVMYGFGIMRWGRLVRFLPYPVIAGFFSGLGLLLLMGGYEVSIVTHASHFSMSLSDPMILQIAAGLFLALLLVLAEHHFHHRLAFPLVFLVALIGFNAGSWIFGFSERDFAIAQLGAGHVMPENFVPDLAMLSLSSVAWGAILTQANATAVLAALAIITLLLEFSGIEVAVNREIDPNRELRSAGLANMLGAILGSPLSGPSSADTLHAYKVGGGHPLYILFYAAFIVAILLVGPAPLAHVPAALMAGVLYFSGYALLKEWAWNVRNRLPWPELSVITVIALTLAYYGILVGVATGFALATLLFVLSYSRLNFIRSSVKGSEFSGNVDRHISEQDCLDRNSDSIRIISLQGFLFFGSAYRLLEEVKKARIRHGTTELKYLIIDFERVDAIDSSAISSMIKLLQFCGREQINPSFAGCRAPIRRILQDIMADHLHHHIVPAEFFADVEAAHAASCDRILDSRDARFTQQDLICEDLLVSLLGSRDLALRIVPKFHPVTVEADISLFHAGDPGDALYLIGKGSVAIQLKREGDTIHMLRKIRTGAMFGEMALYTGQPRSADAVAKEETVLFRLSRADYDSLAEQDPHASGAFDRLVIRLMAERTGRMNRDIIAGRR